MDMMIGRRWCVLGMVFGLGWFGGLVGAYGQLPTLNEAPWYGFFVGHKGSRGVFGITGEGVMNYNHSETLVNVNSGYFHRIFPGVEEATADGEIVLRRLVPESLETTDEPTTSPDTVTYRGEVRGGAKIEVVVEFGRRDVSIGGRIVEPAPSGLPARFVLHVQAPPFYLGYNERKTRREGTPQERAQLERRDAQQRATAARENLVLRRLDGSRVRQSILGEVDLSSGDFNGDGFNALDVDLDALRGRKISITTTENSRMMFSNEGSQEIFKNSYFFTWHEDPAQRNSGRGRLVFGTR